MLTNSDIGTVYSGCCVLVISTLKATKRMMCEIIFIMRVSVRNNAECMRLGRHEIGLFKKNTIWQWGRVEGMEFPGVLKKK